MQNSGDDGVVVVAFGTTLGTLDKEILGVMARAFAKFPQKFIWKPNAGQSLRISWERLGTRGLNPFFTP